MRRRLLIAGLVAAGLACAGLLWGTAAEEPQAVEGRAAAKKRPSRRGAQPRRRARELPAALEEADLDEGEPLEAEGEAAEEEALWVVHGLVIDADGAPQRRARVICEAGDDEQGARTDGEGRFDLVMTAPGACRAWRRDGVLITRSAEEPFGGPPGSEVHVELMLPSERTGGIGIAFEATDEGMRVLEVHPDTPAGRAGLEAGDLIVEVDGLPTATLGSWEFIETMTGPEGTGVTFSVAYTTDTGTAFEEHRVYRSYLEQKDGKVRAAPVDTGD